jgi:glycosyltransferase involved in cell wall biosynthesis
VKPLRLLHAIHDFLPRHRAGSEIYACDLARELSARHDVFVVAAEYDPSAPHGTIRWRAYQGLPVIEIVNNWEFGGFEETYSSPRLNRQLEHVLDATAPDVLHVHNLLNLSFDLPRVARERGIPVVATLHDYTLVCASGGQRVHAADAHVCDSIDTDRCSRCFAESPFYAQLAAGRLQRRVHRVPLLKWTASAARLLPALSRRAVGSLAADRPGASDMQRRLAYSRHVFEQFDRCVAPSGALAEEYVQLGLARDRIEVSDYGFPAMPAIGRSPSDVVRFGFVGTLVWHKGAHQFVDALRRLRGNFGATVFGDPAVSPEYAADLHERARNLPVRFAGPFDRAGLPQAYAGIDVLVVPSLWPENSPLVIHEAFMHGAAVVGSRLGGIPELVTDGVNGFLYNATDAAELARCLQRFVDDDKLAGGMAQRAPRVKPIGEDAREWETRYEALVRSRSGQAALV